MSERCWRCWRPKSNCLCPYIQEVDPGMKFVILMHPKEAYHIKTGTGRLAQLSLKDSEIIIGIDFTHDERLNRLIHDPLYQPVLLYPSPEAVTARTLPVRKGKKLLVIVVDATWFLARKMLRLSTNLMALPKISFEGGYRSEFTFKKEPEESYISTIESCVYLIRELQAAGKAKDCETEGMLDVFRRMVAHQIDSEKQRRALEGDGPQHPWKHDRDNC